MNKFDVKTVPLAGMNLIEASAGTGKTYTLAELYLRLVLEHGLKVEQILVVTYTRAATEELRDRLRQKLVDKRDALLDEELTAEQRREFHTLNLAIQSFDQAAIFTIHGFCQRVLTDFAFESGLRFDVDLIGDEKDLLQAATDDFWRREITQSDAELSAYLLVKRQTPETLLQSVRNLIGKPYLHYVPLPEIDFQRFQTTVNTSFNAVKKAWLQEQDQIIATVQNKTLLNGNKYRSASVEKWLISLLAMMELDAVPTSIFKDFDRFTHARLQDALKKDQYLPELDFWFVCQDLVDAQQQLDTARTIQLQNLRLSLLSYLNDTVPELKQQQQVQSYDDLLVTLEQALNAEQGEQLVEQLRSQYQAALIDEFQDTDPVQYQSFSRIYAKSGLPTFFVGDPKQAIYSFRGADIFTYLKAKEATEFEYTLTTNWRSHPRLVAAVNHIFERQQQAFIYQDIPFIAVDAARPDEAALVIEQDQQSPLHIMWATSDKPLTKTAMRVLAANSTADEISRLLNLAQTDQAQLIQDSNTEAMRALSGGDIAVLVRNHRQASDIQQCLQQRGINSVQQGRDNVFTSNEALLLERLLLAVAEPNNASRIIAVLATPLFGFSAQQLYQLQHDEASYLKQFDFFHELHQLWLDKGFMSMFRHVMVAQSVQQRVLVNANGERQLTNLYHLAELVQDYSSRQNSAIDAVLTWLADHRYSADGDDDTAQLRLESDEQLVKIITIHKSKGLEYPVVFCPFLWDVNPRGDEGDLIRFHDPENDNAAYVAMLEPSLSTAKQCALEEEKAEELRLLYVALTRARERCVITWASARGVEQSALFSLLHPALSKVDTTQMEQEIQLLVSTSGGTISSSELIDQPPVILNNTVAEQQVLIAREFVGTIEKPWRIGSFSALTAGHDAEVPDYDGHSSVEFINEIEPKHTLLDRFKFPRGAQAGTCLHSIFEQWDFNVDDKMGLTSLVEQCLMQYGFDQDWTEGVCNWLCEVVTTPLSQQSSLCLAMLKPQQRLDEMAFYFPVNQLSVTGLKKQLKPYLTAKNALTESINHADFYDLTGFMKGFVDLIFEYEGRYYVVDYKSNYLGASPQDYGIDSLDDAMISHEYPLQYLIYSLALHRYLSLRLPNYDPDHHLGGVYYLFIRGMHPEWGQAGVFVDTPKTELLLAFDRYLQGLDNE